MDCIWPLAPSLPTSDLKYMNISQNNSKSKAVFEYFQIAENDKLQQLCKDF